MKDTNTGRDPKKQRGKSGNNRSCLHNFCCSCVWIKEKVSTNKNRLYVGKYNLDLTYITNRIIASGYPATGFEALYRNNSEDIVAFLQEYHGRMVKIYNLCAEDRY